MSTQARRVRRGAGDAQKGEGGGGFGRVAALVPCKSSANCPVREANSRETYAQSGERGRHEW
eukprot:1815137-Pleurochrysis_carterae.AAC.1